MKKIIQEVYQKKNNNNEYFVKKCFKPIKISEPSRLILFGFIFEIYQISNQTGLI
jgi:hypothetical protein